MTDNQLVIIQRDFMLICHKLFIICAHLKDDWDVLFPELHDLWRLHSDEVFPYELCQHMDDIKFAMQELEALADLQLNNQVFSGCVGEA